MAICCILPRGIVWLHLNSTEAGCCIRRKVTRFDRMGDTPQAAIFIISHLPQPEINKRLSQPRKIIAKGISFSFLRKILLKFWRLSCDYIMPKVIDHQWLKILDIFQDVILVVY